MNLDSRRSSRRLPALLFILAAILALLLLFLPIEIPYVVSTMGKLLPAKEWLLIQNADGGLRGALLDHRTGVPNGYTLAQFERGDAVSFEILPEVRQASSIMAGDTLGYIRAFDVQEEIVTLKASLENGKARLKVLLAGEKPAIVEAAKKRLAFAETALAEQEKITTRLKALFEQGLTSKEEFELSESERQLRKINVTIEKAEFASASTGASPEEIALARKEIDGLEQRIAVLEAKSSKFVITAPISGKINPVYGGDTLLCVIDAGELMAMLPIHIRERPYLEIGQKVTMADGWQRLQSPCSGSVTRILNQARVLDGEQVFFAAAQIDSCKIETVVGAFGSFKIESKPVTMLEYLKRVLISINLF